MCNGIEHFLTWHVNGVWFEVMKHYSQVTASCTYTAPVKGVNLILNDGSVGGTLVKATQPDGSDWVKAVIACWIILVSAGAALR